MIDVVMPTHEKDFEVLPLAVAGALRYITPLRRVCVVSEKPFTYGDDRVAWYAEPPASTMPSAAQLHARWVEHNADMAVRANWVYQHLLKLGAGKYIDDLSPSYLVVDADVIFLRPVRFDPRELRFPYSFDNESHQPYRDAYRRLLGVAPQTQRGLIAHHMLFDRALLGELMAELERRHSQPWYEAYCGVVDYDELSPISVFNTYGWWVLDHHPELAGHRQLKWRDVPTVPTPAECAQFALELDFVAAHAWMRPRP